MNSDVALRRLVAFFETLTPHSLRELPALYAEEAQFKDPFNEVRGIEAIGAIFSHMFEQVQAPRFVVTTCFGSDRQAFLAWEFHCASGRRRAKPWRIRGSTHIVFDEQGRVLLHRDYWDAAEEVYEKLPVLGALMRLLKRAGRGR